VNTIISEAERNNYGAQTLIEAVVMSVPFRYKAASDGAQNKAK
jgi:hypothetical protein